MKVLSIFEKKKNIKTLIKNKNYTALYIYT